VGKGIAASLFMETGVDDADCQTKARLMAGLVGQHGTIGQIALCRPAWTSSTLGWNNPSRCISTLIAAFCM
jgi:predicted TIM-barrel fold metal-dependent hydrolase